MLRVHPRAASALPGQVQAPVAAPLRSLKPDRWVPCRGQRNPRTRQRTVFVLRRHRRATSFTSLMPTTGRGFCLRSSPRRLVRPVSKHPVRKTQQKEKGRKRGIPAKTVRFPQAHRPTGHIPPQPAATTRGHQPAASRGSYAHTLIRGPNPDPHFGP